MVSMAVNFNNVYGVDGSGWPDDFKSVVRQMHAIIYTSTRELQGLNTHRRDGAIDKIKLNDLSVRINALSGTWREELSAKFDRGHPLLNAQIHCANNYLRDMAEFIRVATDRPESNKQEEYARSLQRTSVNERMEDLGMLQDLSVVTTRLNEEQKEVHQVIIHN